MSTSLSVVPAARTPRRRYPVDYKRQVVQESFSPGASVAGVALVHGINANLLHNWRWQYRRGDFGPLSSLPTFVPVQIASNPDKPARASGEPSDARSDEIELVFSAARVVIRGAADPATLRCVIDALRP